MFPGITVNVREYHGPHKWIPGVIEQKLGLYSPPEDTTVSQTTTELTTTNPVTMEPPERHNPLR